MIAAPEMQRRGNEAVVCIGRVLLRDTCGARAGPLILSRLVRPEQVGPSRGAPFALSSEAYRRERIEGSVSKPVLSRPQAASKPVLSLTKGKLVEGAYRRNSGRNRSFDTPFRLLRTNGVDK